MKNWINLFLFMISSLDGCTGVLSPTEPPQGQNLITNSTFELNGLPSLSGWACTDKSVVQFSDVIPSGGSGWSIILYMRLGPAPTGLYNSIFTRIITPSGTHPYRLSFFGEKKGEMGGEVLVYRHRAGTENATLLSFIPIVDTSWTSYSHIDTLTTIPSDTVSVIITGGSGEYSGTTYINTCKFEKLD